MKNLVLASSILFSLQAFACPNLTGSYFNSSKGSIVLDQVECTEISVESKDLNQKLILNNQFSVVQDDADLEAQGRGVFIGDVLVIEVKVKYKTVPPIPRILLPVRGVNNYSQMPDGNLLEISSIYNEMNGVLTSGKTIYKKQ
ncbi:MAG: hypothetical protein H7281_10710 [Bacteriovorax sp.]|nr:hypothetical protein [Bacteriovorax sp.]